MGNKQQQQQTAAQARYENLENNQTADEVDLKLYPDYPTIHRSENYIVKVVRNASTQ